jgi:NADPH:quinone reductase
VLLRVAVAAVNPADVKIRSGALKAMHHAPTPATPVIMAFDCCGVIEALGPGVTGWAVGDEVVCIALGGALAPLTTAYAAHLARKPAGVSAAVAAGCVTVGVTAVQMLQSVRAWPEGGAGGAGHGAVSSMLITGGAGGVGHVAIQLAKRVCGVPWVATTASAGKREFVTACGADFVVDYRAPGAEGDFVKALARAGHPRVDVALDCTGESAKCARVVAKPGGRVCGILGMPNGAMLRAVVEEYHMPPVPGEVAALRTPFRDHPQPQAQRPRPPLPHLPFT